MRDQAAPARHPCGGQGSSLGTPNGRKRRKSQRSAGRRDADRGWSVCGLGLRSGAHRDPWLGRCRGFTTEGNQMIELDPAPLHAHRGLGGPRGDGHHGRCVRAERRLPTLRDDLVVVEMESLAEGAGWSGSSSRRGLRREGVRGLDRAGHVEEARRRASLASRPASQAGGTYELRLRNRHDHPDVTDANDVWVRVDGGRVDEGVLLLPRVSGRGTRAHRAADGKVGPVVLEMEPGVHKVEFSGRSEGFMIDRVHLFKEGASERALHHRARPRSSVVAGGAGRGRGGRRGRRLEPEARPPVPGGHAAPPFAADGGFDAPRRGPVGGRLRRATQADATTGEAATATGAPKTLPVNVRQPGLPLTLPSDRRAWSRTRFGRAGHGARIAARRRAHRGDARASTISEGLERLQRVGTCAAG